MVSAVAKNNIIICEMVVDTTREMSTNGISYKVDQMPIYKVLSVGDIDDLKAGDHIVCSSTGTCLNLDSKIYMFEHKNVIGKVNMED